MIPGGTRFIGISESVNLTERKSAGLNAETEPYTMDDITSTVKPYKVYTALLTQSGGDNLTYKTRGEELTIGVTYTIYSEGSSGWDLTNVGAPNNNVGTSFVATGTTPNSYGSGGDPEYVSYNTGAPVATVLENTIGNVWFTYSGVGIYKANFFNEQDVNKLYASALPSYNNDYNFIGTYFNTTGISFVILNVSLVESNSLLANTPIEIRVYS